MRDINLIVLHHTATNAPSWDSASRIRKYHVEERGYADIGYHFIINSKGFLYFGRPIHRQGAHSKGYNANSIGIALCGDFTDRYPSGEQQETLIGLLMTLLGAFDLEYKDIVGHSHLSDKTVCPGAQFDVTEFCSKFIVGK